MATPVSLICILHSSDVGPPSTLSTISASSSPSSFSFSRELVGQAIKSISGFYHSCRAGSPEFGANICLLRADPFNGCQCVYHQFLPSTSQPISEECTALHTTKKRREDRDGEDGGENKEEEEEEEGPGINSGKSRATRSFERAELYRHPPLPFWHTRSWSWVEGKIWEGLQGSVAPRSSLLTTKDGESREIKRDGAGSSFSSSSAAAAVSPSDGWGCLAGALLMACGILDKQQRAHQQVHGGFQSSTFSSTTALDKDGGGEKARNPSVAPSPPHRAVVLVLSEGGRRECVTPYGAPSCTGSTEEEERCSLSTECAFAIAATTLTKRLHTMVHCFGTPYIARPAPLSLTSPVGNASGLGRSRNTPYRLVAQGGMGAERMVGLVHSIGGIAGERFSPGLWGVLLAPSPWRSLSQVRRKRLSLASSLLLTSTPPPSTAYSVSPSTLERDGGESEERNGRGERENQDGKAKLPIPRKSVNHLLEWREAVERSDGHRESAGERLARHYIVAPMTLTQKWYQRLAHPSGEEPKKNDKKSDVLICKSEALVGKETSSSSTSLKVERSNSVFSESNHSLNGSDHWDGENQLANVVEPSYTVWLCPQCMSTVSQGIPMDNGDGSKGSHTKGDGNDGSHDGSAQMKDSSFLVSSSASGIGGKRLRAEMTDLFRKNTSSSTIFSRKDGRLACQFCWSSQM